MGMISCIIFMIFGMISGFLICFVIDSDIIEDIKEVHDDTLISYRRELARLRGRK